MKPAYMVPCPTCSAPAMSACWQVSVMTRTGRKLWTDPHMARVRLYRHVTAGHDANEKGQPDQGQPSTSRDRD